MLRLGSAMALPRVLLSASRRRRPEFPNCVLPATSFGFKSSRTRPGFDFSNRQNDSKLRELERLLPVLDFCQDCDA